MRKIALQLWILTVSAALTAQHNMGTIEVCENKTATLIFPATIDIIVIGNNPMLDDGTYEFFELMQKGNNCIIRSYSDDIPETSINVILDDDEIFYGMLKYGDGKLIHNFKNVVTEKKVMLEAAKTEKAVVDGQIKEKLHSLMQQKQEYYTYGVYENDIEFVIKNIRNDAANTYMKITINNSTANNYDIDGILFKYVEGRRLGIKKSEAKTEERIMPVLQEGPEVAAAYHSTDIGIVLPLFTVGNKGRLEVQLREKNGTRNPVIIIKSSEIVKIKVF